MKKEDQAPCFFSIMSANLRATSDGRRGAQVDIIIDRNDNVINLCECKFSKQEYSLTNEDDMSIANKVERVAEVSPKRKSIHVTLITTFGVAINAYFDTIQRIIVAEDLFRSISVR